MSILSSNNYSQIKSCIQAIQKQMEEEEWSSQNQFQIHQMKVKHLQQYIQDNQQLEARKEQQTSSKMQQFERKIRQALKDLKQSNRNDELKQVELQINRLNHQNEKLSKISQNSFRQASEKIQIQIQSVNQKLKEKRQQFSKQLWELQNTVKKQMTHTQQIIDRSQQNDLTGHLYVIMEEVKSTTRSQLAEIRTERRNRKEHFLELLEKIVLKIKE